MFHPHFRILLFIFDKVVKSFLDFIYNLAQGILANSHRPQYIFDQIKLVLFVNQQNFSCLIVNILPFAANFLIDIFFPLLPIKKKCITTFELGIIAPDGKHDHRGGHELHASAIVKGRLHYNDMQNVHALLS